MFKFFNGTHSRKKIEGENIFIDNQNKNIGKEIEIEPIFKFIQARPDIKVFENDILKLKL